jgi:hypothetical protein
MALNLDEDVILDWEERKTKEGIVTTTILGQTIHHGVSRRVKHISVIACFSAAGESLLPYIVASQNSSTVEQHLKKQGVRVGRDLPLTFNQKPYFNAGIFLAYIRTILLQYIDSRRGFAVLAQETAVFLMEDCSILDLTLFGVFKRCPRYELPFDGSHATVKVIEKVYHNLTQTMARPNVWGTFLALAFEF